MNELNYFPKNLQFLRKEKKMTQAELANKINVDQTTIGRWEDGNREPTIGNVSNIAKVFDISIPDLLDKDLTIIDNLQEIKREQLDDLSILDNVLFSKKDKIDSVKNLPLEKQKAIANAINSVLDMVDDNNFNNN